MLLLRSVVLRLHLSLSAVLLLSVQLPLPCPANACYRLDKQNIPLRMLALSQQCCQKCCFVPSLLLRLLLLSCMGTGALLPGIDC
jgi:hypothetical protein